MASNKYSCGVTLSLFLSICQIAFLVFIGYSCTFHPNKDSIICLVIATIPLDVAMILKNRQLQTTYWQQELVAIKEAYKNDQGGIRSKKPARNRKDEK